MIVRIFSAGKSFKGLSEYLTHDPEAKTAERVGWTHTHNLTHDDVPSAVDEMLWTARNAELLKQEAGIRGGGRATENSSKHMSLNWSPEEAPSDEHMIKTSEDFLQSMGWHEHQAVFVAHRDKTYAHVHIMLNVVHPETGLALDNGFEQRRAQKWALEYEREQGHIYCEERLKNPADREQSPTRDAWFAFQENQKSFERDEKARRDRDEKMRHGENDEKIARFSEWKILKEIQRDEREGFFAEGKIAFKELRSSVYREVREEFRDRWKFYYSMDKNDSDFAALDAMKAQLIADQKAVLAERRDAACGDLRTERDDAYRSLLNDQRDARSDLRQRQEAGLDNMPHLAAMESRVRAEATRVEFREAAEELTSRGRMDERAEEASPSAPFKIGEISAGPAFENLGGSIGTSVGFGFLSLVDTLLGVMEGPQPDTRPPPSERATAEAFQVAADEAYRRQETERANADREWQKHKELYRE
jgi:hypothetical protein